MELFKRLKYGDLNGKYRNDVLDGYDDFRDVMISIMNVICGNIEIECASAVNSLSEFVKESGKYSSKFLISGQNRPKMIKMAFSGF